MKNLKNFIIARDQKDRSSDKDHYNKFAQELISLKSFDQSKLIGTESIDPLLRYIYEFYYTELNEILKGNNLSVLELGAGYGRHTGVLLKTGVKVTILDISNESLALNMKINPKISSTLLSSIDSIPLKDRSIDIVVSCESLSYADPDRTDKEIFRILKPGGTLIILDSLNHNPIYIINRVIKVILGTRTFNSIYRIPKIKRIKKLSNQFENTRVVYFGKWIWFTALLRYVLPIRWVLYANWILDRLGPNKLAFKFILISKNFMNNS